MASGTRGGLLDQLLRSLEHSPGDGLGELGDVRLLELFLSNRNPSAFETLLRRHGPMVLGVCRRVLGDRHAAEDAFQATFLVLVSRGRNIRKPQALGSWLHSVAYRTALDARAGAARRRKHERQAGDMARRTETPDAAGHDLRSILDAEIDGLPEKHRIPLVLCHLEGKSIEEVAQCLGWPRGTVAGRLARARDQLRARLIRRGLAPAAGALAWLLTPGAASAKVPAALAQATLKAATLSATGGLAAAGAISAPVAALAQGVLKTMLIAKLKTVTASLLALAILAGMAGWWTYSGLSAAPVAASAEADKEDGAGDLKKLHGKWTLVAGEAGGEPFTDDQCKNFALAFFGGGKVELSGLFLVQTDNYFGTEQVTFEGKFHLDAKPNPKRLAMTFDKDAVRRFKLDPQMEAIYHVDGDWLKICVFDPSDKAPEKFTTQGGTGRVLYVLERVGAKKEDKPKGAEGPQVKTDLEALQGQWTLVSGELFGQQMADLALKQFKMIVKANAIELTEEGQPGKGTFKLEPNKSPKQIDLTLTFDETPNSIGGKWDYCGIYELNGDTLKLSYNRSEFPRPRDYRTSPRSAALSYVLKRVPLGAPKPAPAADGPKPPEKAEAKPEKLEGTWVMASAERNGLKVKDDLVKKSRLIFTGDKVEIDWAGYGRVKGEFRTDDKRNPKTIGMYFPPAEVGTGQETRFNGIYELKDGQLRLCVAANLNGEEGPMEFGSPAGSGIDYYVFKRERDVKDQDRIQGRWKLLSCEAEGKPLTAKQTEGFELVFQGDQVQFTPLAIPGKSGISYFAAKDVHIDKGMAFRLLASQTPKKMDMMFPDTWALRKTLGTNRFDAIYSLDDDKLTLCTYYRDAEKADDPPKELAAKAGSNRVLYVLEREGKPREENADPKDDLKALQGVWAAVAGEVDGVKLTPEQLERRRFTIKNDQIDWRFASGVSIAGTIRLEAGNNRFVGLTPVNHAQLEVAKGIYEIKGDELKICFSTAQRDFPQEFRSKGLGTYAFVLKPADQVTAHKLGVDPAKVKSELEALAGTWIITSYELIGTAYFDEEMIDQWKLVIDGNQAKLERGGQTLKAELVLDPTRMPKYIDLVLKEGDENVGIREGDRWVGIYEIKDGKLSICLGCSDLDADVETSRAKDFAVGGNFGGGNGIELYTLRREKDVKGAAEDRRRARANAKANLGDQAELQGTWKLVSGEVEGVKMTEAEIKDYHIIIKDDRITFQARKGAAIAGRFQLNETANPAEIGLIVNLEEAGGVVLGDRLAGIYERKNDDLKICICDEANGTPTRFETKKDTGTRLYVLKRVKKEVKEQKPK